jgi:hypothetical protein
MIRVSRDYSTLSSQGMATVGKMWCGSGVSLLPNFAIFIWQPDLPSLWYNVRVSLRPVRLPLEGVPLCFRWFSRAFTRFRMLD